MGRLGRVVMVCGLFLLSGCAIPDLIAHGIKRHESNREQTEQQAASQGGAVPAASVGRGTETGADQGADMGQAPGWGQGAPSSGRVSVEPLH